MAEVAFFGPPLSIVIVVVGMSSMDFYNGYNLFLPMSNLFSLASLDLSHEQSSSSYKKCSYKKKVKKRTKKIVIIITSTTHKKRGYR